MQREEGHEAVTTRQHSGRLTIFQAAAVDDPRLGHAAFRVLAALGTYSDREGWCYPSQPTVAKRLGITRQAVAKSLGHLASLGYLEIHHQHDERGAQKASRYRLLLDNFPVACDAVAPQPDVAPEQPDVAPEQPEVAGGATSRRGGGQPQELRGGQPEVAQNVVKLTTQENDPGEREGFARARARGSTATRLPAEFAMTPAMRAWAAERVPAVDLDIEHERFCNYWWGSGKTKRDWPATWRTWMLGEQARANQRRPAARAGPNGNGHRASRSESNWALYDEIKRREEADDDEAQRVPGAIDAAFRSHE